MSAEDAKKFIDLVNSSPELQERVTQIKGAMVDLAAQQGLTVTAEELHDELRDRWEIDKPKDDPDTCTII